MTVKELKKKLENVPDNMDVCITQINDEYPVSLVEDAKIVEATFVDGEDDDPAKEEVFLLTDEI